MGQVGAVLDQHRALRGLRDGLEGRPGLAHPDQVPVVDEPDDGLGVRPCCGPYPVVTDVTWRVTSRSERRGPSSWIVYSSRCSRHTVRYSRSAAA
jgi:hypothetical protein